MVTKEQKEKIWQKAKPIRGYDPAQCRHDPYFNILYRDSHGNIHDFGWEFDRIKPKRSSDTIRNLQALSAVIERQPKGESLIKCCVKRNKDNV